MSTYLFAFVVGDYLKIESTFDNPKQTIYVRPSVVKSIDTGMIFTLV